MSIFDPAALGGAYFNRVTTPRNQVAVNFLLGALRGQ
jgi:hypothetical protein